MREQRREVVDKRLDRVVGAPVVFPRFAVTADVVGDEIAASLEAAFVRTPSRRTARDAVHEHERRSIAHELVGAIADAAILEDVLGHHGESSEQ